MKIVQVSKSLRGQHTPHKTMGTIGYYGGYYVCEFGVIIKHKNDVEVVVQFNNMGDNIRDYYTVLEDELTIVGEL
jgi:hypothetical protein